MTAISESGARSWAGEDLGVIAVIAAASASIAALFVYDPTVFTSCLVIVLVLVALLRFDLYVYGIVLLLPWDPLVNWTLPVRDIFLVLRLVLFVGVWVRLKRNNKSINKWLFGSRRKKGIACFAGIAVVAVLLSGVPSNVPAFRSLALLASYLATFFAIDGWLEDRRQLVQVLKLLLISTIGVALFGFYQALEGSYTDIYFLLYPLQEETVEPWIGRVTSILFQYNFLAGYLNLVIPFAIACTAFAKDRGLRLLGFVTACSAVAAVFLTQSRGGLLALAGILLIAVWLLVPRLITRVKVLCGSVLAAILVLPPLLNHFERLQGVDDATELSRLAVWQAAVRIFLGHPLLGVGYGNYRFLYADFVPGAVPGKLDAHNLYLELLAETGIVGFLVFIVLVSAFFFVSLKSTRKQDSLSRIVAFGVCGAIVATLIHGMVDYIFNASPQFGTLFWLVLGLGSCTVAGASRGFWGQQRHGSSGLGRANPSLPAPSLQP